MHALVTWLGDALLPVEVKPSAKLSDTNRAATGVVFLELFSWILPSAHSAIPPIRCAGKERRVVNQDAPNMGRDSVVLFRNRPSVSLDCVFIHGEEVVHPARGGVDCTSPSWVQTFEGIP